MRAALLSLFLLLSSVPASSEPLAGRFPDKLILVDMLRRGDYAALDARLTGYQQAYENNRLEEDVVNYAFAAFLNTDPALSARFDDWVAADPDSYAVHLARAYYHYGIAWNLRGGRTRPYTPRIRFRQMEARLREAATSAERAVEINPWLSLGHAMLVRIAQAGGSDRQVDRLAERGLRSVPYSFEIRQAHLSALAPLWRRRESDRITYLETLEKDAVAFPVLRPLLGYWDYYTARSLPDDEAIIHYDWALEHGRYWIFLHSRGQAHRRLGRHREAIADFDSALEVHPQVADVLQDRARVYRSLDDIPAAMADLDLALAIDPFEPTILTDRAKLHRRAGRYDDALADLDSAMVYGEHDFYVRAERGLLFLWNTEDYPAAAVELRRATELRPDYPNYWYHLAGALYQTNDCDIVPTLYMFLSLCDSGDRCDADKVAWSEGTMEALTENGECPIRRRAR